MVSHDANFTQVLIHGKQILQQCILPPGYLGDVAESKNKFYKHDRVPCTKKFPKK